MEETVVCIPNNVVPDGVVLNNPGNRYFQVLLNNIANARFLAIRDKEDKSAAALENNRNLRQLVVYLLVYMKETGKSLIYRRKIKENRTQEGEARLYGNWALPGGHMNSLSEDFLQDIVVDSLREFGEELTLSLKTSAEIFDDKDALGLKICGIINNNTDIDEGVHLVHTGLIVKVEVDKNVSQVRIKEEGGMEDITEIDLDNYGDYFDEAELWLKEVLAFYPQIQSL